MSDRKLPIEKSKRILADLLKIPVNTICCDCGAANPNWASYSIGCFLCVRCCSVHRKMGTHISKVRSVTLDQWTQEDLDNMKEWGNGKVNALYMPKPERHPPPMSMEGTAMEQYIRAKYERKEFMEGGVPEPAARSAYGNTFSGGRGASTNNIIDNRTYSTQVNALRAMGFTDNAKNLQVLQSTNGDVPNAVEILCRIGSGPVTASAGSNSPARNTTKRTTTSNNANGTKGLDQKEIALWNMGFQDVAMNREALRRAGGNPEVAAGILLDEKEKLTKSVLEKGSTSPLPSRLDPPGSKKNESNLLLDLSDDTQPQQQQLSQQQQQQLFQMQNAFGNSNQQMLHSTDQFGHTQNQLQSLMDNTNASIMALYNNNTANNSNMSDAFGLQQQQQQQQQQMGAFNNMNSWGVNNNNNMAMNSAFGLQTTMPTGNPGNTIFSNTNNNAVGMGMGMNNMNQNTNPFGNMNTNTNTFNTNSFDMLASNNNNNNLLGLGAHNNNNNNQFNSLNNNNQLNSLNSLSSPMSPFNTMTSTSNMNNAFMTNTSQSMNPMGNMGMNGGLNTSMNTGMNMSMNTGMNAGMNTGMNNGFNSQFGTTGNNAFNNNNSGNNNNPWGNNNNNNLF